MLIHICLYNISAIGQEKWEKCCCNVKAVDKSYCAADIAMDEEMDKLVIKIDESSDDDEPYSSSVFDDRNDETVPMVCMMTVSSHYAS